ncbi:MAG: hypothetical protein ACOY3O_11430, partial [Thermodesulfobacteriota bacterium]
TDDDIDHGISNVVFYAVDENGDVLQIKLDYEGNEEVFDPTQPTSLYGDIEKMLSDEGYEGYDILGYTIKAGGDLLNMGTVPPEGTPGDWTDADFEGIYNTDSGNIKWTEMPDSDDDLSAEGDDLFDSSDSDDDSDQASFGHDEWDQVIDPSSGGEID